MSPTTQIPCTASSTSVGSKQAWTAGTFGGRIVAPIPRSVRPSVWTATFSRCVPYTRIVSPCSAASTAAWMESPGPTTVPCVACAPPTTNNVSAKAAGSNRARTLSERTKRRGNMDPPRQVDGCDQRFTVDRRAGGGLQASGRAANPRERSECTRPRPGQGRRVLRRAAYSRDAHPHADRRSGRRCDRRLLRLGRVRRLRRVPRRRAAARIRAPARRRPDPGRESPALQALSVGLGRDDERLLQLGGDELRRLDERLRGRRVIAIRVSRDTDQARLEAWPEVDDADTRVALVDRQ